ncbi:MAG: TetR family transcriptional regulator, partial [Gordonia sp. (in: high G+C Gram-positive bacteria)]
MSNTRSDILAAARGILAEHSLADLTMRRLAADLGVRPNALYWHFPNKQTMLAALAEDILASIPGPSPDIDWLTELHRLATDLRAVLLAVPDSAEVVSSAWASGLADRSIEKTIADVAARGQLSAQASSGLATAICQLTIGLTIEEQTRTQMERLGVTGSSGRVFSAEFDDALDIILDGARARSEINT